MGPPQWAHTGLPATEGSQNLGGDSLSGSSSLPTEGGEPLLALPWKVFDYRYDGDFIVAGLPVLLTPCGPPRAPEDQINGDTGCSVWDASVVLLRFLEKRLEGLLGTPEMAPKGDCARVPPLIIELGAGKGLVGLGAAAIVTAITAKAELHTHKAKSQVKAFLAPRGPLPHACHVLLTDLDYCVAGLREAVQLNQHFADLLPSIEAFDEVLDYCQATRCPEKPLGAAQGPRAGVVAEVLDWSCPEKCNALGPRGISAKRTPRRPLLVVAADVLWLRELVEPFVRTLAFFLTPREMRWDFKVPPKGSPVSAPEDSTLIIVAHQSRSQPVDSLFFSLLRAWGLYAERLDYGDAEGSMEGVHGPPHSVVLFRIRHMGD
ncbi:hypothetical protein cyc_05108 [Cyclospora cayetanensis]|uniref:Uncharacterized protein n=1 Tax=Cyclospora cayetanensis TaxID=88456 RepID=A0A1D3CZA1_9EIME|nr:hypothetical protein cyc_05108 [Cyclospora cayetanensis]